MFSTFKTKSMQLCVRRGWGGGRRGFACVRACVREDKSLDSRFEHVSSEHVLLLNYHQNSKCIYVIGWGGGRGGEREREIVGGCVCSLIKKIKCPCILHFCCCCCCHPPLLVPVLLVLIFLAAVVVAVVVVVLLLLLLFAENATNRSELRKFLFFQTCHQQIRSEES